MTKNDNEEGRMHSWFMIILVAVMGVTTTIVANQANFDPQLGHWAMAIGGGVVPVYALFSNKPNLKKPTDVNVDGINPTLPGI